MRSMIHYAVLAGILTSAPAFSATNNPGANDASEAGSAANSVGADHAISARAVTGLADVRQVLQQFQSVIQEQSKQLEEQRREIEQQKQQLEVFRDQLNQDGRPQNADAPASELRAAASALTVNAPPPAFVRAALPNAASQSATATSNPEQDAPLSIKIGAAKFTPGGYIDLQSVFRTSNATAAGGNILGTSFTGIPYSNTVAGGLSEVRLTAQGTRLTLRADSAIGKAQLLGYGELDFNGYMPYQAYVSTNADAPRLRLFFTDLRYGKWEVSGGQDWSLMSPNRVGAAVLPADVYTTIHTDTNYVAGYVYARQGQVRLQYHATPAWTVALGIENPEQLTGSAVTFPALFSTTQVDANSATAGQNTGTPNFLPDFIVKIANDSRIGGHLWHVEAAGLVTNPKIVTPASVTKTTRVTDTSTGGAGSLNFNLELVKSFHLIANSFWSDGAGRYIGGLTPEFVVRQTGSTTSPFTLSLVHSASGLGGFEWQTTKSLLVSGLYGGAYIGRNSSIDPSAPTGPPVGYGYAKSANNNNRAIQEASFAWNYTFWKNPSHGSLQLVSQSAYVTRAPWYVAPTPGTPKNAHVFMQYTGVRYFLP